LSLEEDLKPWLASSWLWKSLVWEVFSGFDEIPIQSVLVLGNLSHLFFVSQAILTLGILTVNFRELLDSLVEISQPHA
jgi:hypothetical protein